MFNKIYDKIPELNRDGIKSVLYTIVSDHGSTPRKAGAKMIVTEDQQVFGTIGGGVLEKTLIDRVHEFIKNCKSEVVSYNLSKDLGMVCGGSVEIFIEPLFNKFRLIIFGAGHIGKALVKLSSDLNFDITVIDDRENIFDNWDTEEIKTYITDFREYFCLKNMEHDSFQDSFIVIATSNHSSDKEILKHCINRPFAYLGLIGSRKKIEEIKKLFISENMATIVELNKIDMPIGLDILAEGPEEIAISIAAKLILEKNLLNQKKY